MAELHRGKEITSEVKQEAVIILASKFHNVWRVSNPPADDTTSRDISRLADEDKEMHFSGTIVPGIQNEARTALNSLSQHPTTTYKPKFKPTTDDGWKSHNNSEQVDIANTDFPNLPSDWQKENLDAAEVAIDLVLEHAQSGGVFDENFIETASAEVHSAWCRRNPRTEYNAALHVDYSQLTEEDKEKDRQHIRLAIKVYNDMTS